VLDLAVTRSGVSAAEYRLLPVFSNALRPHAAMSALIEKVRAPTRRSSPKNSP
jgi:sulfur-oxidizing protein SoxB